MTKYIENVTRRFGSFHVAPNKSKLVPGNLERYLNDMIPGFKDSSKRASNHQGELVNGNSNRTKSTENGLGQSQSGSKIITVKREPNDSMDSDEYPESEVYLEVGQTDHHPDVSNVLAEILKLKEQEKVQTVVIAELREVIRIKNEEFESQRRQWERSLQDEQITMLNKLKDAKTKQWCSECYEMINESSTQTCQVCSLFQ